MLVEEKIRISKILFHGNVVINRQTRQPLSRTNRAVAEKNLVLRCQVKITQVALVEQIRRVASALPTAQHSVVLDLCHPLSPLDRNESESEIRLSPFDLPINNTRGNSRDCHRIKHHDRHSSFPAALTSFPITATRKSTHSASPMTSLAGNHFITCRESQEGVDMAP